MKPAVKKYIKAVVDQLDDSRHLDLREYVAALEELKYDVQTRLDAAHEDLARKER